MRPLIARATFQARVAQTAASPAALRSALAATDTPAALPDPLHQWLTRLRLLYGVPFNYLVPDEAMLPPESIRFFYLDANWTAALLDGAFSIGRQPAPVASSPSPSANLDRAVLPDVQARLDATAGHLRARLLGVAAPAVDTTVVSGFLLRSELVANYPGMTLRAYPAPGTTPEVPLAPLPILRLEQLGPTSNTLLCLVAGDAYQVIAQEAPEQLHYGFDDYVYNPSTTPPFQVRKQLHSLSNPETPLPTVTDFSGCFRSGPPSGGGSAAPVPPSRTVRISGLAAAVAAANSVPGVDAAQLGFTMIEGAGQVQFVNTLAPRT